jgi:hypothetical protein
LNIFNEISFKENKEIKKEGENATNLIFGQKGSKSWQLV